MKRAYFLLSFLVCMAMVACETGVEIKTMANLEISNSYISIAKDGGSTSITINATESWAFDSSHIPSWLTISPVSGGAGETNVNFSADATTATRKVSDLQILVGSNVQYVNVEQSVGIAEVSNATCAEVLAGPDGKTYRVSGKVTSIANTTYGNWYLQDETGEVYIYGTLDANGGTQNFLSLGIEVGDNVTVEGPKTTYNGTVELVDVTVVSIEKSLISAVDKEVSAEQEGGIVDVRLLCKGNGVNFTIPSDAQSWVSVQAINAVDDTSFVSLNVLPNEGGDRTTTLEFTTVSSGETYSTQVALSQAGSIIEVSVAEFIAAAENTTVYRLTGVVTSITNDARGRFNLKDYSGEVLIYNLYDANNAYVSLTSLGVEVGDIITILGNRGSYNGTIEAVNSTFESKKDVTEISLADFLAKEDNNNVYYRVTGTVTSIVNDSYGNLYMADGDNSVYVYGCYTGYGATGDARKNFATLGVKVGDLLTMIGYKDTYNGVIELCGGTYFSHTSAAAPSIEAVSIADFLAKTTGDTFYQLSGKINSIANDTYGNFYLEDATDTVYVYGLTAEELSSNDKSFASLGLKVGDYVTIQGKRGEYNSVAQVAGAFYKEHITYTETTVANFLAAEVSGEVYYKLTGVVSNVASETYGNFDLVDETGTVYVYGLTNVPVSSNNKSYGSLGIKAGDTVTLIGKRAAYNSNPQVGNAWYVSHAASN